MKIGNITVFVPVFKGQRQDRNTVSQLKEDNLYDLNLPNQRRINKAIENLSKIKGEENVRFLLDVSENLKYGTNIDLGKKPYNQWQEKLIDAAEKSLNLSDAKTQEKYVQRLNKIKSQKEYSDDEKAILDERNKLLGQIDFDQINKLEKKNMRNIRSNLDYFVISSEVPTSQKLYILKRLNHFMSDDYQINSQLKDKKNQALAEIINDIVVDTPESNIPNSKEINQLHHGICASISICRKALAYEDKANYVDMIMSELDNSSNLMVYDINKLGSHSKIAMPKIDIDFKTALERGYRIVDTAAMYWMNVGDTGMTTDEPLGFYSAIDSNYFDTFTDAHMQNDISPELADKHDYYRGLVKAKSVIGEYKAKIEKNKISTRKKYSDFGKNIEKEGHNNNLIKKTLYELSTEKNSAEEIRKIFNDLKSLQVNNSDKANKITDYRKNYVFLNNEEKEAKINKIHGFLSAKFPEAKSEDLKYASEKIYSILDVMDPSGVNKSGGIGAKIINARNLYNVAASYRTQQVLQLNIPEHYKTYMTRFNIPDNETKLIQNINSLITKIDNGTINPEVREKLAQNLELENDPEILSCALGEIKNQVEYITTDLMDKFYNSILLLDRRHALATQYEYLKNELDLKENKPLIKEIANELHLQANKEEIQKYLQSKIDLLESENCTQEDYIELFNKIGLKSQIQDFTDNFEKIADIMFTQKRENVIQGFNLINGLAKDAPIEQTHQKFIEIAQNFDKVDSLLTQYHNALHITNDKKEVLNTTDSRYEIIKKLEDFGEIPKEDELKALRRRFTQIDKLMSNKENNIKSYSDLPKSYGTFTPLEKQALKNYYKNINPWYSKVNRRLVNIFREIREPLEEHNRSIGVKTGFYWVPREGNSGLYSAQEVKIIQHMTDRPYYVEEDGKKALDKIKNGVYSGVSGTSVDHTQIGMHAQYIADIKPVSLKDGRVKTVVFHDNSWGSSEKENIWQDKDGLTRTDYERKYGGELGYITNDKYMNGNFEENILNKVGEQKAKNYESKILRKLNYGSEGFRFPLLSEIITAGVAPNAALTASSIKNNFIISPYQSLPDLEKYAHTMTKIQIKKAMERGDNAGKNYDKIFDKFMRKIIGNPPFDSGISTLEDYNKLPENGFERILLDKVAILKSYNNIADRKDFISAKTQKDLKDLKEKVRKDALKDFYYTFGKNNDIKNYTAFNSNEEITDLLELWIKENNINAKTKDLVKVIDAIGSIKTSELDGSMEHTIDKIVKNFTQELSKQTPNFENKKEKISQLSQKVKEVLVKDNYLSVNDKLNLPHIENWIDKNFNPITNEEFVKIFNDLRNLTTKEFDKLYAATIDNESLGIKEINGYNILQGLRAEHEQIVNAVYNQIYQQEYYKDITTGTTKCNFDYNKFSKDKNNLATYVGKKTFDEIYTDYSYSLSLLKLDKLFNRWKGQNYKKYGVLPAYPTVQIASEEKLDAAMEEMYRDIEDRMMYIYAYDSQIKSMNAIKNLQRLIKKYNNTDGVLTTRQYNNLWDYINEFAMLNEQDETMEDVIEDITNIAQSETRSISEYKNLIEKMYKKSSAFEKTADGTTVEEAKKIAIMNLKEAKKSFLEQLFEPVYQQKASVILNKWISARVKAGMGDEKKAQEAEMYYNQFTQMYKKHSVLKTPEMILEEFLMLNAKDGERLNPNISPEKKQELDNRNDILVKGLKGLLFKANIVELQMNIMRCLQNGNLDAVANAFRNSRIELNNGTYIPLSSPDGLNILFSSMLSKENNQILIDFFNQMNLGEVVVEATAGEEQFKDAKKNLKRIHSILASVDSQIKFLNNEIEKIKDIDNDPNYLEKIEQMQSKMIAKVKRTNYRSVVNVYNGAFSDIYKEIKENPKMPKHLIINTNMDILKDGLRKIVKANLDVLSQELKRISEIQEILRGLNLSNNSKAEKLREEFMKECDKLIDFQEKLPTNYKNIQLETE